MARWLDTKFQYGAPSCQTTKTLLTRYLSQNVNKIFKSIAEPTFQSELRDKLEGMARIYRLNRNDAGHPDSLPQDWRRDEQECYLNQFRRYVLTVFSGNRYSQDLTW